MGFCSNCGSYMADKDYGKCYVCTAAHVSDDVPCQRCGMYLPRHELQMWNARYYCQYCIMDIRDEEKAFERRVRREEQLERPERQDRYDKEPMQHYPTGEQCQRCGKAVEMLYDFGGRRLCRSCLEDEGGKPPTSPSSLGAMVGVMRDLGESGVKVVEKARTIGEKIREAREKSEGMGTSGERKHERTIAGRAREMLGFGAGKGEKGGAGEGKPEGEAGKGGAGKSFDIKTRSFIKREHGREVREVAHGAEGGIEFDPKTRRFVERAREEKEERKETGPQTDSQPISQEEKGQEKPSREQTRDDAHEGRVRLQSHEQFAHRKMHHDETRVVGGLSRFRLLGKKLGKEKKEK
jgi:hypothetical protein